MVRLPVVPEHVLMFQERYELDDLVLFSGDIDLASPRGFCVEPQLLGTSSVAVRVYVPVFCVAEEWSGRRGRTAGHGKPC